MTIHIAIVEDEAAPRQTLQECLERFSQENGLSLDLACYEDALSLLDRYEPVYDLIFMDIQLPGLNGMEAARRLRALDGSVLLVFVTNLAQYAIAGYEVSALDYILKPIHYQSLSLKLTRALWRIDRAQEESLAVSTGRGKVRISLRELIWVEVDDHLLIYHTRDGRISELGSLSRLEEALQDKGFARCSNSSLVNLSLVTGIKGYQLTLKDGTLVKISQPRKKRFAAQLEAFRGSTGPQER